MLAPLANSLRTQAPKKVVILITVFTLIRTQRVPHLIHSFKQRSKCVHFRQLRIAIVLEVRCHVMAFEIWNMNDSFARMIRGDLTLCLSYSVSVSSYHDSWFMYERMKTQVAKVVGASPVIFAWNGVLNYRSCDIVAVACVEYFWRFWESSCKALETR